MNLLLVCHLDRREIRVEGFGANERAAAEAHTTREYESRDEPTVGVVMVGADSVDTVRKTHSDYFAPSETSDLVADLERELSDAIRVIVGAGRDDEHVGLVQTRVGGHLPCLGIDWVIVSCRTASDRRTLLRERRDEWESDDPILTPLAGLRSAGMSVADADGSSGRLAELRVSARGWHGIQLAVIGFIGFCGVVQEGRPDNPEWLQVWAGILALVALVLACVATFLVGRVAWPLFGGGQAPVADVAAELELEGRRLRRGLLLTFVALALLALGTASGWWPQPQAENGANALVTVQASSGERVCGSLDEASPGTVRVSVDGKPVVVSLRNVVAVNPVDSC